MVRRACVPGVSERGGGGGAGGVTPLTPISQYYMQVEPGLDRIALAVHDRGMSANQSAAVDALVQRYWAAGVGGVLIQAPAGGDAAAGVMGVACGFQGGS